MKYAVVLCDGMADYPVEALGGATPMEKAKKPTMDWFGAVFKQSITKIRLRLQADFLFTYLP